MTINTRSYRYEGVHRSDKCTTCNKYFLTHHRKYPKFHLINICQKLSHIWFCSPGCRDKLIKYYQNMQKLQEELKNRKN